MLMLSETDRAAALALEGAAPFDPMGKHLEKGNAAMRGDKVQMPEALMDDAEELRGWVKKAFVYAAGLPGKKKRPQASKKERPQASGHRPQGQKKTPAKKPAKPKKRR